MSSVLRYHKEASHFVEALPLGNGHTGAMIYGKTGEERISLNHDTLWSGHPNEYNQKGAKESFNKARELALEGKLREAQNEIEDNFLWVNSEKYLPLGNLYITLGGNEVSEYVRTLDLDTAVVNISYRIGNVSVTREAFCSFPHDVLAMRISGADTFTVRLESPLKADITAAGSTILLDGICPGLTHAFCVNDCDGVYEYPKGRYTKGVSFRTALRVITDGKVETADGKLTVSGAKDTVLLLVTKTNYTKFDEYPGVNGDGYKTECLAALDEAAKIGYDALKAEHITDYKALYDRISLDLGETDGKDALDTDERLRSFEKDHDDPGLYTLLFNYGRYLTIAASREGTLAMNLQGIWNESMNPPWRCNYTTNINTEMNYFPTLMCGLFECEDPLHTLIKSVAKTGRKVAKYAYGARGFVSHHNIDPWGHANAKYWMACWGYWCGSSGWFCRHLYDYYAYTLDTSFLRKTAYPIMREASRFYMDILTRLPDGKLAIVPGTSPENEFFDENGEICAVALYSTMLNSIARDALENTLKAAEVLGIQDDFTAELKEKFADIEPFHIGKDGRLLEWDKQYTETEPTHRHVSHLYALHPAHMISPEKTPELADACRKTLAMRGDDGSGWSLGWKINFHARLNDGDHALKLLDMQLRFVPTPDGVSPQNKSGSYANLFDAHPPFQIDGNFGAVSGILEMLARCDGDDVYLLPALPKKWQSGSIKGLRLVGGNTLDMTWKDGKLETYLIKGKTPVNVWYRGEKIE